MTDNDIVKALACCYNGNQCAKSCPYNDGDDDCVECTSALARDTLDLINRQKAEIERLTINMNAFGLGMKREKERADTAKAEAIKEFAERVKLDFYYEFDEIIPSIMADKIDNLAKEMTEETTKYILNREATT